MGYYIETPHHLNKAEQLCKEFPETKQLLLPPDTIPTDGHVLVCVVQNGIFDAAAICFSNREKDAFNNPSDYRDKDWLVMRREDIEMLISQRRCPASVLKQITTN